MTGKNENPVQLLAQVRVEQAGLAMSPGQRNQLKRKRGR